MRRGVRDHWPASCNGATTYRPGMCRGKPPVLGSEPKVRPSRRRGVKAAVALVPAVKLAPIPNVEPEKPVKKTEEPAAQKPDMKLPADALRASKAGGKPLSAHLRRHEESLETAKKTDSI